MVLAFLRRVYILRIFPVESRIYYGSSRSAYLDAAATTKFGHAVDPGYLYVIGCAQFRKRLRYSGIGVFRQENIPGTAGLDSFAQLLGTHNQIHF